ncbi:hypothetical protein BJ742DRAFT_517341 [Cladochytrium replicatum]|nr:hypothetical protein BJ742DRAFT_517341 [Cladochytrium replicatum]
MSVSSSGNGLTAGVNRDESRTTHSVDGLTDADLSLYYKSSPTPPPLAVAETHGDPKGHTDPQRAKDWLSMTFASLANANTVEPPEERNRRATEMILNKTDVVKASQTLQARLSYARYKVEHGWQTKPLAEVRKLYDEQIPTTGSENAQTIDADQDGVGGVNGEREDHNKRRKPRVMVLEDYSGEYDEERILAAQTILALSGHKVIVDHRPPHTSQPDTPRLMNPSAPDVVDAAIGLLQAGGNLYNSQQTPVRAMPNLPTPQPSPPQTQLNGGSQSVSSIGTPPEQHASLPPQQQVQQSTQRVTSSTAQTNQINEPRKDGEVSHSAAKGKTVVQVPAASRDSPAPSRQRKSTGRKGSQNDSSAFVPSRRAGQPLRSHQQTSATTAQPETTSTIQSASPREPALTLFGKGKAPNTVISTTTATSTSSSGATAATAYRMERQNPTLYQAMRPSAPRVRNPQEQFPLGTRTFIPSSQPLGMSPQPHHIIYTDDPYGVTSRPGYTLEVDYGVPGAHPQLLRGSGPPMAPQYISEIPIYHGGPSTAPGAPTAIGYTLARPHWQPTEVQQNLHRRLSGMEQQYGYSIAPPMVPHSYVTGGPNAPILIRIPATTTIQTSLSAQAWSGLPQLTRRLSDPTGQMHLREEGQVIVGPATGVRTVGMYPPASTRIIPSNQEGGPAYDVHLGSGSKIYLYEGTASGNGTAPGPGGDS